MVDDSVRELPSRVRLQYRVECPIAGIGAGRALRIDQTAIFDLCASGLVGDGQPTEFRRIRFLEVYRQRASKEGFSASDNSRTARGRTALWKWDPGIGIPHADSASAAVTVERTGAFMGEPLSLSLTNRRFKVCAAILITWDVHTLHPPLRKPPKKHLPLRPLALDPTSVWLRQQKREPGAYGRTEENEEGFAHRPDLFTFCYVITQYQSSTLPVWN